MRTLEDVLAVGMARHETVAYRAGDDPSQEGRIRDGGYRCACGSIYGVREYVPTGQRREREPHPVGPTKQGHILAALAAEVRAWIGEALTSEALRMIVADVLPLGYTSRDPHANVYESADAALTAIRERLTTTGGDS